MKTRATTDGDKHEVLARLLVLWQANPELRLGQLICNFYKESPLYNCEDFTLIERLERGYAALAKMRTTP